jgi:O-antigen/teichoic acid export membrane protein
MAPQQPASLSKRALHGMAWSLAAQITVAAVSLLSFAIIGRIVTPARFGVYLMALVGIGAVQWLAQNAWREPAVQASEVTDDSLSSMFWLTVAVGFGVTGLALAVAMGVWYFSASTDIARCIGILSVKLLFDTITSIPAAIYYRRLRFSAIARVSMSASLVSCALSILLLWRGWDIFGLAIAQVGGSAVLLVLTMAYSGWRPQLHFSRTDLKALRDYTPHVMLWQLVELVNLHFDRFMIGTRLSSYSVGIYGFGRRLNDVFLETLVGAVANVTLPTFAAIQNDIERVRRAYIKAVSMMSFLIFPLVVQLFVNADDFVPLVFGSKWDAAIPVYRWCLLLGITAAVGTLQATLVRALGHAKWWSRYQLLQSAVNVIVVLCVVNYGIVALAAAMVIRSYSIWGLSVSMTCRLIDIRVSSYLKMLAWPLLWALASGIVAVTAMNLLNETDMLLRLICRATIGTMCYVLFACFFMRAKIMDIVTIRRS